MRASARGLDSLDVRPLHFDYLYCVPCGTRQVARLKQALTHKSGPATDYSANMAQFVHNRRPQYKGTMGFEMERPSASYVIDVSLCSASAQIDDAIKSSVLTPLVDAPTPSPQRQCSRLGSG